MGEAESRGKEEEMNGFLLDTHILIWIAQNASNEVSKGFFAEVDAWSHSGKGYASPISCWEMGLLTSFGQLGLSRSIDRIWENFTRAGALKTADLSARVLLESTRLPGSLHRDPADRILAATAREYGLTLVTRDGRLLDYAKQGHLNVRKP